MFLILFLTLINLVFSQEILVLNIEKAVKIALENNREIQIIKQQILSLEDIYRAEKWNRFSPKTDLFIDKDGFNLFTRVLLIDFGNRLARIDSARIRAEIKKEFLREFERQVKIKLAELFMKLYLAEKLAEVRREEMAVAYVRFDRERERLEQGLSDRVKVAEWEREYRKFRADLLRAQRLYNETLLEIKRFLGIDLDTPVEIRFDEFFNFEIPENVTIDTEYILKRLENNYLLRVKKLEIEFFESRAKEQRRIFYPELSAYFGVRRFYEENEFDPYANLVLRIPIFDGKTSFYREKSFLDLKRAVEIERKNIYEALKREALIAPYRWEELMGEYIRAITFDNWAQENLDLSRSNYELELAFDLGYAMSTKTEAERQVAEARFRIIIFLMRLYNLMGKDPLLVFKEKIPFFVEKVEEI